jgi:hypothetical protein
MIDEWPLLTRSLGETLISNSISTIDPGGGWI